jgi:lipopolysaccharide transport system permease protein
MTQREVLGRYKGSFMGLAWSFFTPLLMLAV